MVAARNLGLFYTLPEGATYYPTPLWGVGYIEDFKLWGVQIYKIENLRFS